MPKAGVGYVRRCYEFDVLFCYFVLLLLLLLPCLSGRAAGRAELRSKGTCVIYVCNRGGACSVCVGRQARPFFFLDDG